VSLAISVVVPTYNRATLVPATLDSILAQTLPPTEVIVIDDGSTDDTAEVLRRYGRGVKCVTIENAGVCHARKVGAAMAQSPWIALCDSDDLWKPEKLAMQAELVSRAPDVEFVFCNSQIVTNDEWQPRDKLSEAPRWLENVRTESVGPDLLVVRDSLYEQLIEFFPTTPSTLLLSRPFLDRIGGLNDAFTRSSVEDIEFVLRCSEQPPMGIVTRPLVGMRRHDSNAYGNRLKDLIGKAEVFKYALKHHRTAPLHRTQLSKALATTQIEAADLAFLSQQYSVVAELLHSISFAEMPAKSRLKWVVSTLPAPARGLLAGILLRFARAQRGATP
jgi:glycosyltransferase involved in cell wall biosynthesis